MTTISASIAVANAGGLSVQRLALTERASTLFEAVVHARSADPDLDLEALIGQDAWLRLDSAGAFRLRRGVCREARQTGVEATGLSTYAITIVPRLWLLTQRQNHRVFQHESIPDMVDRLLSGWGITPVWRIDRPAYPRLEQRIQYGESDHGFFCRLLEEAGISFWFEHDDQEGTRLVLKDRSQSELPRLDAPLRYFRSVEGAQLGDTPFATAVRVGREMRSGRFTTRDHDFRRPGHAVEGRANDGGAPEEAYEQYHFLPGASLIEADVRDPAVPVAEDRGAYRHREKEAERDARRGLRSERDAGRRIDFQTSAITLEPGSVFSMGAHPRAELGPDKPLLVTSVALEAEVGKSFVVQASAVPADRTYRPPRGTPRPAIRGVQPAVVVGPAGAEIHADEHGRVRVRFRWDREERKDEVSSCWMRVSQAWAGAGHGLFTLPRVGDEVLVSFFEGNPDQPVVVGRVYDGPARTPYPLPEASALSVWRSASSPAPMVPADVPAYNEIRLDDTAGAEEVLLCAAKDLTRLVKGDAVEVIGGSVTARVGGDDRTMVGGSSWRQVLGDEVEHAVGGRTIVVGGAQQAVVGGKESRRVGSRFSVNVVPGLGETVKGWAAGMIADSVPALTALLPGVGAAVPDAIKNQEQRAPSAEAPAPPADGTNGAAAVAGAAPLEASAPAEETPPAPAQTWLIVDENKIVLTTGRASLILDGADIKIAAEGNVFFVANGGVQTTKKATTSLSSMLKNPVDSAGQPAPPEAPALENEFADVFAGPTTSPAGSGGDPFAESVPEDNPFTA